MDSEKRASSYYNHSFLYVLAAKCIACAVGVTPRVATPINNDTRGGSAVVALSTDALTLESDIASGLYDLTVTSSLEK